MKKEESTPSPIEKVKEEKESSGTGARKKPELTLDDPLTPRGAEEERKNTPDKNL